MCKKNVLLCFNLAALVAFLSCGFLPHGLPLAHADGQAEWELSQATRAPASEDGSSANYQKSEQLLPGEEVVTPTGQKMKVWSTNGPVAVDRAPEPFEDREKTVLDGAAVVVDPDDLQDKRNHRHPRPDSGPHSDITQDR